MIRLCCAENNVKNIGELKTRYFFHDGACFYARMSEYKRTCEAEKEPYAVKKKDFKCGVNF